MAGLMVKLPKGWSTKTSGETCEQPNLSTITLSYASERLRMELSKLSRGMNEQKIRQKRAHAQAQLS